MEWSDLEHFLALVRNGTLAAAARASGVEHTTVRRRIDALEQALGAKLFARTPEGFVLTEVGKDIVPYAEEVERAIAAIERRASGDERIEGRVRLTTSEAFTGMLVKSLGRLKERHPALVLEVLTGNERLDLARREADVAVRMMKPDQPDLLCKKLIAIGWSLYASTSYVERRGIPADIRALDDHDVVGFGEAMAGVPGAIYLAKHAARANVVLSGNSILSTLNAAIVGMGIAALPCFLVEGEKTLQRLTPEVIGARDVWLLVHPDIAKIARVRAVMDFVEELVRDNERVLTG